MLSLVLERVTGLSAEQTHELSISYDLHAVAIFKVLRRLGVPESSLDDAVQDVFFVAWRRRDAFERRSTQRTWLFGIARKVARDYRRRRRRAQTETPELDQMASPLDPTAERNARDASRVVAAALERMSDVLREVFVLVELEELSAPEIAEILGIPVNTVYSRTRLAREQFRTHATALLATEVR
jgi:RNA polymerase sigma-70 factor (ECF subfamily)